MLFYSPGEGVHVVLQPWLRGSCCVTALVKGFMMCCVTALVKGFMLCYSPSEGVHVVVQPK
jgi:hypothetical protein